MEGEVLCPACTFSNDVGVAKCAMCATDLSGGLAAAAEVQPVMKKSKVAMPALGPPLMVESSFRRKFEEAMGVAPSADALNRISLDLKEALRNKHSMFRVLPERKDLTKVHALLFGPSGTPYEFGLFHFQARFPATYPWQPPMVMLRTTDNNQVCLSILGTWTGPSWTPVQTLTSVLLSIVSLLNPIPYHNEPGFEGPERVAGEAQAYNNIIRHETLRVAVCGMLEHPTWPVECDARFLPAARESFVANYDKILASCAENAKLNGKSMEDPFGQERHRSFDFDDIARRVKQIKAEIDAGTHLSSRN